jgi:hypothetical protein
MVVDATGYQNLKQDFMAFPDFLIGEDDDSEASDESGHTALTTSILGIVEFGGFNCKLCL